MLIGVKGRDSRGKGVPVAEINIYLKRQKGKSLRIFAITTIYMKLVV